MLPFLADDPVQSAIELAGAGRSLRVVRSSPRPPLVVERCSAARIEAQAAAWADLAARALEPNAFMEPGFALPAIRHLAPASRPDLLLCWETRAGTTRLVGLLALQPRRRLFVLPVAEAWHHPLWVTSAPLLDRDRAGPALSALLGALAGERWMAGGLMLRGVALDGPLMQLLGATTAHVTIIEQRSRAVLRRPGETGPTAPASRHDAKRAKEMRRQRRRLAEAGGCVVRSACSADEVRVATERFLELEARGWKGARGTALLKTPRLATFTRAMTRLLAAQGLCRVVALEVGGEAAAMAIVLRSGNRAFFWKIAYDERRARHSPGKLLAEALGALQQAEPTVALTDSCAVPDHPMIDALWKDRIVVADVLVPTPGANAGWSRLATTGLRLARVGRGAAKRAVKAAKARLKGR